MPAISFKYFGMRFNWSLRDHQPIDHIETRMAAPDASMQREPTDRPAPLNHQTKNTDPRGSFTQLQ
ncbi:hypothetical protein OEJ37_07965 [Burkholderia sp. BKH01]|uniref:hypothetical protein n=1 Tax=Burkholderia sp. BKH01 TaxID=2769262 RepID=UPI0021DF6B1E|nr:hypothetical protein [Burkholderia sp. BKH01]MCU9953297.1 hypothetical protein [Burkholderia sp. BKH01]